MLRAGNTLRFTAGEIEQYRLLGLDFAGAQSREDIEQALGRWTQTLADERPALLDKIALEMVKVKGVRAPPVLGLVASAVPFAGSPGQC